MEYKGISITLTPTSWRGTIAGKEYGMDIHYGTPGSESATLLKLNAKETIDQLLTKRDYHVNA